MTEQHLKSIDELLAAGLTPEKVAEMINIRHQAMHIDAHAALAGVPSQPDADWKARKARLLSRVQVHGVMRDFYLPALACVQADDQAGFARWMDLCFMAIRSFTPDPPAPVEEQPAE